MRVVLGGVISRNLSGEVLHRREYAEGLRRLGHDVMWIEELSPDACIDERGRPTDYARAVNRRRFRQAMRTLGLEGRCTQIYDGGASTVGLDMDATLAEVGSADLLLNFSGHVRHPEVLGRIPRRAYLDSDPVFTQLWSEAYGADLGFAEHHVFFSRGANLGTERSPVPTCGLRWRPYMPPLVTDRWPAPPAPAAGPFTTIAAWGRYGDLEHRGEWYRSKNVEFARLADLPRAAGRDFRLALSGDEYDPPTFHRLVAGGWEVLDGGSLGSLDAYLGFIRSSGAEIGSAKHAYVKGRVGWFSERSTQYMASGKPVLVQDTGLEGVLPTGRGLLTFRTLGEAVAGAEAIASDYDAQARAARELAREHFDHRTRLGALLDACFDGGPDPVPAGPGRRSAP